jgi:peptide/nickel transport system permease protein
LFRYLVKRLLLMFVTLFGITAVTFLLTRLTPGDPAALKIQASGAGMSRAVGGYDELVERNRRNLGLDKPLLLNFHFEDRLYEANRALDDYLRRTEYWQKDGEKRLQRVGAIALKPALDRYALIGTPNEPKPLNKDGKPKDMAEPAKQKERLVELFARLAGEQLPGGSKLAPDEAHKQWVEWFASNGSRYDEAKVRDLVAKYLATADDAASEPLQKEVQRCGGYSVPYLIAEIDSSSERKQLLASRALQTQVGFSFVVSEADFSKVKDEVTRRWLSWWRREKIAFSTFSPVGHAINIFGNTQFGLWVKQAATFDFGDSYIKRRSVLSMMKDALPISALISGLSIIISYLIAIPLGILSAVKRHSAGDKLITLGLFILYSLPSFWVASILLLTVTGPPYLSWFPSRGLNSDGIALGAEGVSVARWLLDRAWHIVLPVTVLTYGSLAFISRQMRSAMLETIGQDFIRTAQAKGLPWRIVVFKHAFRNSLIPIITISAGILPELIAGAIITESIFTIPGMGILTFEAIVNRDYPVINAVLFFSAFLTLLGILLADLCYALVDPRISYD